MALAAAGVGRGPGGGGAALGPSALWTVLYVLGMVLLFTGERIIGSGNLRFVFSVAGVLLVAVAIVARMVRSSRSSPDRRAVEQRLLGMYALGLLSVALYAAQSDLPTLRGGKALATTSPKLATVLGAIWPALWTASTFAAIAIELAYAPMRRAPRLEIGRVRAAQLSGLGLAFAITFAMAAAYIASERDKRVDLAYFRTTRPGESTRKIVRTLDAPLTVALFFPTANEVRDEVDNYFRDLAKESSQLKIERWDHDIEPGKAKEYNVSANGIVVFARGGRKEQLGLQLQIEAARTALRSLDREVQQRLLTIVKPGRVTYLTRGHGERSTEPTEDTDRRAGVRDLKNLLVDQGHDVRDLGPAEGLGTDIPKEATLVMILGPTKPFAPEELSALQRYLDRGGRLYLALDPGGGVDLKELLGPLGLKLSMTTLANEQMYARRTHQSGDHVNIYTRMYSSHPSVSTLTRMGAQAPVLLPEATAILGPKDRPGAEKEVSIDYCVHAHFATFADTNGNFVPDTGEERKAWELAAAVSKKKGHVEQRLFVIGDSDFLTDPVWRWYGNPMLILDPVRWLVGDESIAGAISTEADVPITHTRKQDLLWFYSTIFAVPAVVVGLGLVISRRRRRGRSAAAPVPASENGGAGVTPDKGAQP
jgi:hypothetical protein